MALRVAKIILLALCLVVLSSEAHAVVDGNTWKRMNKGEQYGYIFGVVDTWENAAGLSKTIDPASRGLIDKMFAAPTDCIQNRMPYSQLFAIVEKFMADNPSQWHYGMSSLVWSAVAQACGIVK